MTPLIFALIACGDPSQGTFVGNPSLTVFYEGNEQQQARSGVLVASQVQLLSCEDAAPVDVGEGTFAFVGGISEAPLQIPSGTYCGATMEVDELIVGFDEPGEALTTVSATTFTLSIEGTIDARGDSNSFVRLGGNTWLADLADATEPGQNPVEAGPLFDVFFGGLDQSSTADAPEVPAQLPPSGTDPEALIGRTLADDYPTSPNGVPSVGLGCGEDQVMELAFPIPPAAMATMGLVSTLPGWCESDVDFGNDLSLRTSVQVDFSDYSSFDVSYNGWGQSCDALHCGLVYDAAGAPTERPCTVLAFCDNGATNVTAVGYSW